MEKKVPPYIVDVITNWCSHSMELQNSMEIPDCRAVWKFLKKTKNRVAILSSNPTPGNIPDKTLIQKDTCILVFIAAVLRTAKM